MALILGVLVGLLTSGTLVEVRRGSSAGLAVATAFWAHVIRPSARILWVPSVVWLAVVDAAVAVVDEGGQGRWTTARPFGHEVESAPESAVHERHASVVAFFEID
jgi:hypothetical protein